MTLQEALSSLHSQYLQKVDEMGYLSSQLQSARGNAQSSVDNVCGDSNDFDQDEIRSCIRTSRGCMWQRRFYERIGYVKPSFHDLHMDQLAICTEAPAIHINGLWDREQ